MSGRPRHYEVRRRRSTDTLSTFDELAPPYALSDVGRPRNDPDRRSRIQNLPSLIRYGYRVDDLLISYPGRWPGLTERKGEIEIATGYTNLDLPLPTRAVVESLKVSIRLGIQVADQIRHHFTLDGETDSTRLCWRIGTLWQLCVMVGAAMCGAVVHANADATENMLQIADGVRSFLQEIDRMTESYGLVRLAAGRRSPRPSEFTAAVLREHAKVLDAIICQMTNWNFILQAKPIAH